MDVRHLDTHNKDINFHRIERFSPSDNPSITRRPDWVPFFKWAQKNHPLNFNQMQWSRAHSQHAQCTLNGNAKRCLALIFSPTISYHYCLHNVLSDSWSKMHRLIFKTKPGKRQKKNQQLQMFQSAVTVSMLRWQAYEKGVCRRLSSRENILFKSFFFAVVCIIILETSLYQDYLINDIK